MDQDFFQSSEFYSNRYKNFSTIVIVPCFIALILAGIFLIFGKKEIVVDGIGYISPAKQERGIQTTVNSEIKQNYLREGKSVKKGRKLIVYKNVNSTKREYLSKQEKQLESQLEALNILENGVRTNSDTLSYDDIFGYHHDLKAYLTQINIYSQQNNILNTQNDTKSKKENSITSYNKNINTDKAELLQSEKLSEVLKEENKLQKSINQLKFEINSIDSNHMTISAPISGIIHVNPNYAGLNRIGVGSTIATIYPDLQSLKRVKLNAYISQRDIGSIHKGQQLKFKIAANNAKTLILDGKINNISTTTEIVKGEQVFQITATTKKISNKELKNIKYGMQGTVSVVTGKATFFEFYKDKLLNKKY